MRHILSIKWKLLSIILFWNSLKWKKKTTNKQSIYICIFCEWILKCCFTNFQLLFLPTEAFVSLFSLAKVPTYSPTVTENLQRLTPCLKGTWLWWRFLHSPLQSQLCGLVVGDGVVGGTQPGVTGWTSRCAGATDWASPTIAIATAMRQTTTQDFMLARNRERSYGCKRCSFESVSTHWIGCGCVKSFYITKAERWFTPLFVSCCWFVVWKTIVHWVIGA